MQTPRHVDRGEQGINLATDGIMPTAAEPVHDIDEPIGAQAQAEIDAGRTDFEQRVHTLAEQLAADRRVMLDSANPVGIPSDAPMVAGYVDGHFAWSPHDWQRFDGRPRIHITVEPFNRLGQPTGYQSGDFAEASVIDSETGAFSINATSRFVPARNHLHPGTATIYIQESNLEKVLRANRQHDQDYWLWLAWYIGRLPTVADIAGILRRLAPFRARLAAWQWHPGPLFDTSSVLAPGWHPDPKAGTP